MKHLLAVSLLTALAIISGCSSTSGPPKQYEPRLKWSESYDRKVFAPRRNSPAILVKSENDIDKSKFIEVGQPYTGTLVKACFNGQCKNYDAKRPSVDRLLEMASFLGATHLVLEQRDFVKRELVYRDTDKCGESERHAGGVVTNYDAGGNYTPGRGVYVEKKLRCYRWATENGDGEYVGLRGTAWRYAPQAAATLRKLNNIVIPYITTDKKTGKCSYIEPLFNSSVASDRDVCFPYFRFANKAHQINESYYALASFKDGSGTPVWQVLNLQGHPQETLADRAPPCARNDTKCLGKFIKSELIRREMY